VERRHRSAADRYGLVVALTEEVDGFRTAYDDLDADHGVAVVLLHGWPGDRHDFRSVVPLLAGRCRVVVPDLRGFGETEGSAADAAQYAAAGQARSVVGLVEALGLGPVVVAGYDVGSRVAQQVAATRPDLVRALVVSPPLPGAGERVLSPSAQGEFWYQSFHQLELAGRLVDGSRDAASAYLEHFWTHWSGPDFEPDAAELDRLATGYGRPGAFVASINWYRAGAGMVARSLAERAPSPADRSTTPTTVLWPEHDPLFPRAWSDRLDEFLADVELRPLDGVGHFTPAEAPEEFARAIRERLDG
jgi:pimeloyl-ACP methyl ester carboxylesterase